MKTITRKSSKTIGTLAKKIQAKATLKNYPDTEGRELPEPTKGLSESKQAKKDAAYVAKQKAKETARSYAGAPIPATKLFQRKMTEFKNCVATNLMAFNEVAQTVCFLNVYQNRLPASFDASHYTFAYVPKKHDKKMAEMQEIDDVTEWPAFVVNAHATKRAKKSK